MADLHGEPEEAQIINIMVTKDQKSLLVSSNHERSRSFKLTRLAFDQKSGELTRQNQVSVKSSNLHDV